MKRVVVFACAVGATSGIASAGITIFTDRTAWELAAGGLGDVFLEDFNSQAVQTINDGATLDTGLIQITRDGSANGGDGDLEIRAGTSFGNIDGTNFLYGETGVEPHETVRVGFGGTAIVAFGADFVSPFSGDGIGIKIGDEVFLLDSIGAGDGFFGFIDDTGSYDTIEIVGTTEPIFFQELWQADNFGFVFIPAPSALGIMGLAGLAAARRRR